MNWFDGLWTCYSNLLWCFEFFRVRRYYSQLLNRQAARFEHLDAWLYLKSYNYLDNFRSLVSVSYTSDEQLALSTCRMIQLRSHATAWYINPLINLNLAQKYELFTQVSHCQCSFTSRHFQFFCTDEALCSICLCYSWQSQGHQMTWSYSLW